MKTKSALAHIAQALVARANCQKSGNGEWLNKWESALETMARDFLPHGSGFDSGTKIDLDRSNGRSWIIFTTAFHHMNEGGYYDGWTHHEVKVTPCLHSGFDVRVSGKDRNEIKDYIAETFSHALEAEYILMPDGEYVSADLVNAKI
jgi:hypothetical protein